MTTTGKKSRKKFGTRAAAKRAKGAKRGGKRFGQLPFSASRKNTAEFLNGTFVVKGAPKQNSYGLYEYFQEPSESFQ